MRFKSRQEAYARARTVRSLLRGGTAWKTHVRFFEGWYYVHWSLGRRLTLHDYWWSSTATPKFSCLLSIAPDSAGGENCWFSPRSYRDPNKAVQQQLKIARAFLAQIASYANFLDELDLLAQGRRQEATARHRNGGHAVNASKESIRKAKKELAKIATLLGSDLTESKSAAGKSLKVISTTLDAAERKLPSTASYKAEKARRDARKADVAAKPTKAKSTKAKPSVKAAARKPRRAKATA